MATPIKASKSGPANRLWPNGSRANSLLCLVDMRLHPILTNVVVSIVCGFLGSAIGLHFLHSNEPTPQVIFNQNGEPGGGRAAVPIGVPECEADASSYCSDANASQGGAMGCLIDYFDQVAKPCQEKLKPFIQRWKPCEAEVNKFCPGTKVGRMRIPKCLRPHMKELGSKCQAAFSNK